MQEWQDDSQDTKPDQPASPSLRFQEGRSSITAFKCFLRDKFASNSFRMRKGMPQCKNRLSRPASSGLTFVT